MYSIKLTYRFIALILAFLVFFTSVGFSLDMHFCEGKLKTVNLFGKAKSCHKKANEQAMNDCHHHCEMMVQNEVCSEGENNCCENKTLKFDNDQDKEIQTSNYLVNIQSQSFFTVFVIEFFADFLFSSGNPSVKQYKPPLILRNIPVLVQSFLL